MRDTRRPARSMRESQPALRCERQAGVKRLKTAAKIWMTLE